MVMDNPHGMRPEHLRNDKWFEGEIRLIRPWCPLCNPAPQPKKGFTAGEVRLAALLGLIVGVAGVMFFGQWWK